MQSTSAQVHYSLHMSYYPNCIAMTGTCIKQGSAYQPSSTMYLLPATNHLEDSGEK